MSATSLDDVRHALRINDPAAVIGLRECAWLDVKGGPYRLDSATGKEELVKDVAAFANAATGGLLLIGFKTQVENGEEIVSELGPIPRDKMDLDQHRKLIRTRVMPPPRGFTVEWIDCGDARGVLVIDIPAQSQTQRPFVVPGPSGNDKASERSVAVPVREADGTHWLPQSEIRRLLALGWAEAGGPSEEVLSALVTEAVSAASRAADAARPAHEVGVGEPGWRRPFREAYERARQLIHLGRPTTEVYRIGPGVAQEFESGGPADGWIICALPDQLPVTIAESVWDALHAAGSGVPDGDVLGALGLPFIEQDSTRAGRVVNELATVVELRGGRWGTGLLVRADSGRTWTWEPSPSFSLTTTRYAGNWTGGGAPPLLRVRAIATLPSVGNGEREIPTARRREFAMTLPISELAGAVTILSQRRGADLRAAQWKPGPNRNARDAASFSTTIETSDHRSALSGEVMAALPNATSSAVVTCAELRIYDLAAWADVLGLSGEVAASADLRLSLEELTEFLSVAWQTATEVLPAIITPDPRGGRWAGPPTVELRLSAEQKHDVPGPPPLLTDLVDFAAFGERVDAQLTSMAVTITAPPQLPRELRRALTRQAFVYMGQAFGFTDASEDQL